MKAVAPFALLRNGWSLVRRAGLPLFATMLAFQLLTLLLATPLLGWLFKEALRANGMVALDFGSMPVTGGIAISLTLIVVIMVLAFWLASAQFVVVVLMLRQAHEHRPMTIRSTLSEAGRVFRKLLRPSSIALFFYLFFILPLSGFGFVSVLSQGITVPTFISGELMKSPASAVAWVVFVALIAYANLRLSMSFPLFAVTTASGGKAMRQSWRHTRGRTGARMLLAVLLVLTAATLLTVGLLAVAIVPTAIADAAGSGASVWIAAYSLGTAQLLSLMLTALVVIVICALLVTEAGKVQTPQTLTTTEPRPRSTRAISMSIVVASLLLAAGFGSAHIGTMQNLSQHPDTLVLAHRGFSDLGAENTVEGLEAAASVPSDMVEIDVMQTSDKRFVVMHDAALGRLAGTDLQVKDLTLEQLTNITVRDQHGHEGKIPSLEQYMTRAAELDMPLLIEIKLGGLDTPDLVELLVAELEALDSMPPHIFHTLDFSSVETLKRLRPDATVGYILAFAGGGVPETSADFIVVEQWTATQEMQQAATEAGLGFFAWTVNEEAHIRELLRRDINGIITDHPDAAITARTEMGNEQGLAGTLIDALTQFVVVF